jgi:DNA-binding PadR family transcriptional regulator
MNQPSTNRLPQVTFSILFGLSLKPRHGYELMQQVEHDSDGKVRLGPGALYGTIKKLVEANLIEEMPFADDDQRRRHYRLTRKGWNALSAELEYFENTVRLARERNLLDSAGASA